MLQVVNPIPEVVAPVPLNLPNGKSLPSFTFKPTSQAETKRGFAKNEMVVIILCSNLFIIHYMYTVSQKKRITSYSEV